MVRLIQRLAVAALFILLLGACAGNEPLSSPRTTTTTTTTTTPAETTSTAPAETTSTTTTTTFPGTPIDLGPQAGDELLVVGINADDMLDVHVAPGVDQEIVASFEPLRQGIKAVGESRELPDSIWFAVETDQGTGWVDGSSVAYGGLKAEATQWILDQYGGIPEGNFNTDIAELIAHAVGSADPASRVHVVADPWYPDMDADEGVHGDADGNIRVIDIVDVIGIGDDSIYGYRLTIHNKVGGDGVFFSSAERQYLCSRGVTDDGLCV